MDVEHKIVSFPIDPELQDKVEALAADKWELIPGVPPVAVYHLVRVRSKEGDLAPLGPPRESFTIPEGGSPRAEDKGSPGGLGKLIINEDKILVIPAKK